MAPRGLTVGPQQGHGAWSHPGGRLNTQNHHEQYTGRGRVVSSEPDQVEASKFATNTLVRERAQSGYSRDPWPFFFVES